MRLLPALSRHGLDAAWTRDGAAALDGSFFCLSETAPQMLKGTLSQGEKTPFNESPVTIMQTAIEYAQTS